MASKHGNKRNNTSFKAGHKGMGGSPVLPPEIRSLALISRKKATALLGEMLAKDVAEIRAIFEAEAGISGFDRYTAAVIMHAIGGSPSHSNAIMDRLYGAITQKVEFTELPTYQERLADGKTAEYVLNYPDGSQEILGHIKD